MKMKRLFSSILAGFLVSGVAAAAEPRVGKMNLEERLNTVMQDAVATQAAIRAGKKVTLFCGNCHGEGGNSNKPDIPNLAGQNAAYLLEQMNKFVDERRRNDFMQGMIKALNDEEKVNAVVYFSAQEVRPHASSNPALASHGKELYFKVCQRCHGEQGRGNEKIPRIAGQQPDYLTLTLKRYRDGTGERIEPLMAANTRNLKDADINALVAFVSGLK